MEEAQNWLDKPSENSTKKGTSQKDQEGPANILCTPKRTLEGKVWNEELCSSEENNSLWWVCRYYGGQYRYIL